MTDEELEEAVAAYKRIRAVSGVRIEARDALALIDLHFGALAQEVRRLHRLLSAIELHSASIERGEGMLCLTCGRHINFPCAECTCPYNDPVLRAEWLKERGH